MLPVSGLAMGGYLAMLFAVFFIGSTNELAIRRLAWKVLLVLAGSVAGSAVWFTIVQKWIIGEFCIYCMTAHITGLIIAVLIFWRAVREPETRSTDSLQQNLADVEGTPLSGSALIVRPLHATRFFLAGLALACIMAVSQVSLTSSGIYSDGSSQENLPVIDSKTVPMIGSPDAPYVVRLLFDYQCPHCQKLHFMLNETVHRYNGKLAFVLCPTPLNTQCNPYIPRDVGAFKNSCELAKIGLTVWLAKREAFPAFENWMFTYETGDRWHPRSLEAARKKAVALVGQSVFSTASSNPWIGSYLQSCVRIFGETLQGGNGGIPKLIYGSRWVIPEPSNTDDLIMILQKSLALPKP
jgi:hypothetical protein